MGRLRSPATASRPTLSSWPTSPPVTAVPSTGLSRTSSTRITSWQTVCWSKTRRDSFPTALDRESVLGPSWQICSSSSCCPTSSPSTASRCPQGTTERLELNMRPGPRSSGTPSLTESSSNSGIDRATGCVPLRYVKLLLNISGHLLISCDYLV